MGISTTQIGIVADNTTTEKTGNVLSVKDDGITSAKINVVGLEGATGKVNDINSTNFKDLDAVNLTNTGDLVKIADVEQGSATTTMVSGTIDVSAYKTLLIKGRFDLAGNSNLNIAINGDTTANNYDGTYVYTTADTHGAQANNINVTGTASNLVHYTDIIIENNIGGDKNIIILGMSNAGDHGIYKVMRYDQTGNIITIGFSSAENIQTTSKFSIYGIK